MCSAAQPVSSGSSVRELSCRDRCSKWTRFPSGGSASSVLHVRPLGRELGPWPAEEEHSQRAQARKKIGWQRSQHVTAQIELGDTGERWVRAKVFGQRPRFKVVQKQTGGCVLTLTPPGRTLRSLVAKAVDTAAPGAAEELNERCGRH